MLAQPSSLQFTNRYTYDVYQQYSLYRCTLHIMYGYTTQIIHDITLLLTTTHNSQLTTAIL
jgi:non-ribosomal peptide synthetase component F